MANTTKQEKSIKQLFIGKCWSYLDDNFHKFTDDNKIKIALTLVAKDIPQEVSGLSQQIVVMNEIKKEEKSLRYNLESNPSEDTGCSEQTSTIN